MLSSRSLLGVAALIAAFTAIFTAGCGEANRGVALYGGCVSCHGAAGNGNAEVGAPAIAGLPQWYIETQLKNFRGGVRGYHGDDITGLRMTRYVLCSTCHGPDGKGMETKSAPPIANMPDWYLMAQLQKFKGGMRGTHPKDMNGAVMRANAMTLPDDQTIKDVVAYIQTLPD